MYSMLYASEITATDMLIVKTKQMKIIKTRCMACSFVTVGCCYSIRVEPIIIFNYLW